MMTLFRRAVVHPQLPLIFAKIRCKRLSQTSTLERRRQSQFWALLLRQGTPEVTPCLRQITQRYAALRALLSSTNPASSTASDKASASFPSTI